MVHPCFVQMVSPILDVPNQTLALLCPNSVFWAHFWTNNMKTLLRTGQTPGRKGFGRNPTDQSTLPLELLSVDEGDPKIMCTFLKSSCRGRHGPLYPPLIYMSLRRTAIGRTPIKFLEIAQSSTPAPRRRPICEWAVIG